MEYIIYATENPMICLGVYLIAMLSIGLVKSLYVYFRYYFGGFADHPFVIIPWITMDFFFSPYTLIWNLSVSAARKTNIIKDKVEAVPPKLDSCPLDNAEPVNTNYDQKMITPSDREEKIAYYTEMLKGFDNPDERQIIIEYIKTL